MRRLLKVRQNNVEVSYYQTSYVDPTDAKRYDKVRQVLQSATVLLQNMTGITKCDDY